ncbi:hypothetical protein DFJ73DRAFT_956224 [Zopfochytrium polystomum]|nr:hypothetical protein DFJ73DRAFT_956224 [Zopfochytrium polystomum]
MPQPNLRPSLPSPSPLPSSSSTLSSSSSTASPSSSPLSVHVSSSSSASTASIHTLESSNRLPRNSPHPVAAPTSCTEASSGLSKPAGDLEPSSPRSAATPAFSASAQPASGSSLSGTASSFKPRGQSLLDHLHSEGTLRAPGLKASLPPESPLSAVSSLARIVSTVKLLAGGGGGGSGVTSSVTKLNVAPRGSSLIASESPAHPQSPVQPLVTILSFSNNNPAVDDTSVLEPVKSDWTSVDRAPLKADTTEPPHDEGELIGSISEASTLSDDIDPTSNMLAAAEMQGRTSKREDAKTNDSVSGIGTTAETQGPSDFLLGPSRAIVLPKYTHESDVGTGVASFSANDEQTPSDLLSANPQASLLMLSPPAIVYNASTFEESIENGRSDESLQTDTRNKSLAVAVTQPNSSPSQFVERSNESAIASIQDREIALAVDSQQDNIAISASEPNSIQPPPLEQVQSTSVNTPKSLIQPFESLSTSAIPPRRFPHRPLFQSQDLARQYAKEDQLKRRAVPEIDRIRPPTPVRTMSLPVSAPVPSTVLPKQAETPTAVTSESQTQNLKLEATSKAEATPISSDAGVPSYFGFSWAMFGTSGSETARDGNAVKAEEPKPESIADVNSPPNVEGAVPVTGKEGGTATGTEDSLAYWNYAFERVGAIFDFAQPTLQIDNGASQQKPLSPLNDSLEVDETKKVAPTVATSNLATEEELLPARSTAWAELDVPQRSSIEFAKDEIHKPELAEKTTETMKLTEGQPSSPELKEPANPSNDPVIATATIPGTLVPLPEVSKELSTTEQQAGASSNKIFSYLDYALERIGVMFDFPEAADLPFGVEEESSGSEAGDMKPVLDRRDKRRSADVGPGSSPTASPGFEKIGLKSPIPSPSSPGTTPSITALASSPVILPRKQSLASLRDFRSREAAVAVAAAAPPPPPQAAFFFTPRSDGVPIASSESGFARISLGSTVPTTPSTGLSPRPHRRSLMTERRTSALGHGSDTETTSSSTVSLIFDVDDLSASAGVAPDSIGAFGFAENAVDGWRSRVGGRRRGPGRSESIDFGIPSSPSLSLASAPSPTVVEPQTKLELLAEQDFALPPAARQADPSTSTGLPPLPTIGPPTPAQPESTPLSSSLTPRDRDRITASAQSDSRSPSLKHSSTARPPSHLALPPSSASSSSRFAVPHSNSPAPSSLPPKPAAPHSSPSPPRIPPATATASSSSPPTLLDYALERVGRVFEEDDAFGDDDQAGGGGNTAAASAPPSAVAASGSKTPTESPLRGRRHGGGGGGRGRSAAGRRVAGGSDAGGFLSPPPTARARSKSAGESEAELDESSDVDDVEDSEMAESDYFYSSAGEEEEDEMDGEKFGGASGK